MKLSKNKQASKNRKRIYISIFLLLTVTLLASGCGGGQDKKLEGDNIFTDSLGNQIQLDETPQRIVSLSPAITEILFAIGLDEEIVGTTDYCDYPEAALDKPKVGGFNTLNIELIVQAEPDIIFIASGVQAEYRDAFNKYGFKTFILDAQNIDQVVENIELAGLILDRQDQAKAVADDIRLRKDYVMEKTAGLERPLVFFEVWDEPLLSAGPETFIADILETVSAINFAHDAKSDYPQINLELILDRDPDFYIAVNHKNNLPLNERPGFESLKAVKNKNYFRIEDDYVTLPGPRIIIGLEEVANFIHPHAFE